MSGGRHLSIGSWQVWLLPGLAAAGLLGVQVDGANETVFRWLNAIGPQTSDLLWANITVLGDTVVALAVCLPLWRRRPDLVWALAVGAVLATAWVHVLKPIFDAPRPPAILGDAVHIVGPAYKTHSFPSGHATTIFAVAALIALGLRSPAIALLALGVAAAAAASRSVVGVHWPIDVLAGVFGGWLSGALGVILAQRFRFGMRPAVQWFIAVVMAGCAVALVAGYRTGYPQALWFQRAIGVVCLAAAGLAWYRDGRRKADGRIERQMHPAPTTDKRT
jgi:membrane-associated phospholipid phosphatase